MVDALIKEIQKPEFGGSVFGSGKQNKVVAHYLIRRKDEKGHTKGRLFNICYEFQNNKVQTLNRYESPEKQNGDRGIFDIDLEEVKSRVEAALQQEIITWLPERQFRAGLQISLIGLHID